MKILLTGGTGVIGRQLGKELVRKGHELIVISRSAEKAKMIVPFPCEVLEGDLGQSIVSDSKLNSIEAVIHLAGENVGEGRWSEDRKNKILESRSVLTENLLSSLKLSSKLKCVIAASAVGYYGDRKEESLTEESSLGQGFLAKVCQEWEDAILKSDLNVRKVILRTGVVLTLDGGALPKMILPFQFGIGAALGNGQQFLSWIHIQDMVNMYIQALEDSTYEGIFNAVAPNPVTNAFLTKAIGQRLNKMVGPAAPSFVLKTVLGEMAAIVLDSQRVIPRKLQEKKFQFLFSTIESALDDLLVVLKDGNLIFKAEQYLKAPRPKVFSFFSDAFNLEEITPPLLNFKIKKVSTQDIQKGTLIDYRLKIHGIPVNWRTEISTWNPNSEFVDEQLNGPYKKWHHTHRFEDLGPGTLMTDIVIYQLPVGVLGWILAGALVKRDIEKIFSYRRSKVHQIFSK